MEIFFTVVGYAIDAVVILIALISFWVGITLVIALDGITIGKASSQLIAIILSIFAFYQIDSIPLIEEILPVITIDNLVIEWIFFIIFSAAVALGIYNVYIEWDKELSKIKEDASIFYIMCLFSISSVCFGYVV